MARTFVIGLVVTTLLLAAGCGSSHSRQVEIPFRYHGLDAGPNPMRTVVELPMGQEDAAVTSAIHGALRARGFSVVSPEVAVGEPLPARTEIRTDTMDVTRADMQLQNDRFPGLAVTLDRQYGLQYRFSYAVGDEVLHLESSAVLHHRSLGSPAWLEFEGQYPSEGFLEEFEGLIQQQLLESGP